MEQLLEQIEALHMRMPDILALSREDQDTVMNRIYDIAEHIDLELYGPVGEKFHDLKIVGGMDMDEFNEQD